MSRSRETAAANAARRRYRCRRRRLRRYPTIWAMHDCYEQL